MCDVTYELCDTGWRRLIGSLKLQIIFHKRATEYRSLLRKMTYKDKRSDESSPPCITYEVCDVVYEVCDVIYELCDVTYKVCDVIYE